MRGLRAGAAIGAWLMVAVIIALAAGMARWGAAWLALGLLFLVGPSQLAWQLARPGRRLVPVGLALAAGTALGFLTWWVTPLSVGELRQVSRRLVAPDPWDEQPPRTAGDRLCLDRCPTIERRWTVQAGPAAAAVDAVALLRGAGLRVVAVDGGDRALLEGRSGQVEVDVVVAPAPSPGTAARSVVRLSLTTAPRW